MCSILLGRSMPRLQALEFIQNNAPNFKLRRFKRLPVSGAFHTELMRPAVEVMKKALAKIPIEDTVIPG